MVIPMLRSDLRKKAALDAGSLAAFGGAPERYFSAPGRTEIGDDHTDHAGVFLYDTIRGVTR